MSRDGNILVMLICLIPKMLIPSPINRMPPTEVRSAIMLSLMWRVSKAAKRVREPW